MPFSHGLESAVMPGVVCQQRSLLVSVCLCRCWVSTHALKRVNLLLARWLVVRRGVLYMCF